MRRTPEKDDANALAYAGILGHRYVVTAYYEGKGRRSVMETDQADATFEDYWVDPRMFEQVRLQKGGRRWRRIR